VIDRSRVQELLADGALLIEVLPAENYADAHLPTAINIPLKTLDRETTASLDRSKPVIVYCHDSQ
jgi:rhodanese-related sulfurtransferase